MSTAFRRTLQVVLPVAILAVGAGGQVYLASLKEEPSIAPPESIVPLVGTILAERSPIDLVVHTQGVVLPRTETRLVAEVEARVLELSPAFVEGGFFEKDEVLLRLDDTDLRLGLEDANSRLASAELLLAQEEADAEIAIRDWRSVHPDEQPPPLVARAPQLAKARAELAAAKAALTKAERDVVRSTILAPYPGRVRERYVDVGTYVSRGRELALVYAVDSAEIHLPIPDEELDALELALSGATLEQGPAVRIEADFAGALHHWDGRIVRTTASIDPLSRMVVLVAEVEDPYGLAREGDRPPLYVGLFVDAWIEGKTLNDAVSLPREALRSGGSVYVLNPEDRLEVRAVDVAHSEKARVVLRSGLDAGERVITTPLETPAEGMLLRESAKAPAPTEDDSQ